MKKVFGWVLVTIGTINILLLIFEAMAGGWQNYPMSLLLLRIVVSTYITYGGVFLIRGKKKPGKFSSEE